MSAPMTPIQLSREEILIDLARRVERAESAIVEKDATIKRLTEDLELARLELEDFKKQLEGNNLSPAELAALRPLGYKL